MIRSAIRSPESRGTAVIVSTGVAGDKGATTRPAGTNPRGGAAVVKSSLGARSRTKPPLADRTAVGASLATSDVEYFVGDETTALLGASVLAEV
jgi:hypothetical protein